MSDYLPLAESLRRKLLDMRGELASSRVTSLGFLHPTGVPDEMPDGPLPLLSRPSISAPTDQWRSFRDTCNRFLEHAPSLGLSALRDAATDVIAWRSRIPAHLRFWPE